MDEAIKDSGPKVKSGFIIPLVMVAIVAGLVGFLVGTKIAKPAAGQPAPDITAQLSTQKVAADSIITSQEAVAVGKIVKVDTGSITIQGKDGKVAGFKLAPYYNIYPLAASGSAVPKAGQNIQDIKLNENYLVHLVLQDGNYAATTIQALPKNIK